MPGAGNSLNALTYSAVDRDPFSGGAYYRLRQVDYDGYYTYSGVVSTGYCNEETISVFSNPLTGNVLYVQDDNSAANVVIKDMLGRVCFTGRLMLDGSR